MMMRGVVFVRFFIDKHILVGNVVAVLAAPVSRL
jgi:hypothetical protein